MRIFSLPVPFTKHARRGRDLVPAGQKAGAGSSLSSVQGSGWWRILESFQGAQQLGVVLDYLGTLTFRSVARLIWGRVKQAVTGEWFPAGAVVIAVTVVAGWLLWSHYSAKWDAVRETERKRDQHWEHQIAKTNAAAAEQQLVRDRTAREREAQMRARWDAQIAILQGEVTKREALIAELRNAGEDPVLTRRQISLFRRGTRQ